MISVPLPCVTKNKHRNYSNITYVLIYIMKIHRMLISYVKLDHTQCSNNYGIHVIYNIVKKRK